MVLIQLDGDLHPMNRDGTCECGSDKFELVSWEDVERPVEEE